MACLHYTISLHRCIFLCAVEHKFTLCWRWWLLTACHWIQCHDDTAVFGVGNKGSCTYEVCDRCVLGRTDEHHQQLALLPWLFLRSHVALSSSSIAFILWMFRRSQVMLEAFGWGPPELSCTCSYCTNGCSRACLDSILVIKACLLGGLVLG